MRSLWFKLMAAFAVVIIIGVAVTTLLANRATAGEFQHFMLHGSMVEANELVADLGDYYARTGSWAGVNSVLAARREQRSQGGMSGMMGGMMGMMSDRLIVANQDGTVVADTAGRPRPGQRLTPEDLAQGTPIIVRGQRVGTLVVDSPMMRAFSPPEQEFLARVNRAILLSGLVAGGIALMIGSLLFLGITAPLRTLTAAAQRIAAGDLSQRVNVHSRDEIGELSQAFNTMAESLSHAETVRRNLMADVAHELRTPLSIVQGNLEAILDGIYPATPETIASIHEETVLLSRLVDDLRDLALADAGQLAIHKEPTDMADVIQGTVTSLRPQAEAKGITLKATIAPDLPGVSADPQRLEQVLRNLLANALRYTPAGGQVEIHASAERVVQGAGSASCTGQTVYPYVRIAVSDTGVGIAPEDLPHLFDRFWRGDKSRSRSGGGAGLGLAIARQIVEAHGGHIWAESQVGQGARFTFVLPAAQDAVPRVRDRL